MLYVDIFLKNDDTHELFFFEVTTFETDFSRTYICPWRLRWALGSSESSELSLISLNIQGSGLHPEDGQRRLLSIERLVQSLDSRNPNKWPIATKNPPKFPELEVRF